MKRIFKLIASSLLMLSWACFAAPRFSIVPLVFQNDFDVKAGYFSATLSGSQMSGYGIYDANQHYVPSPMFFTNSMDLTINYGLTDEWDLLVLLNYSQNDSSLKQFDHIGDTSITLGYSISDQESSKLRANSRIEFTILIPSGKFNGLNPFLFTTDATGGGSYQPAIGFSYDSDFNFKNGRTLNLYSYIGAAYAFKANLEGLNAYGGAPSTKGFINPGHSFNFSFGATYNLTDKVAISMEYDIFAQQPSSFKGQVAENLEDFIKERLRNTIQTGSGSRIIFNQVMPTFRNIGGRNFLGSGSLTMLSVSPTISYSITDDWNLSFTMSATVPGGKNTTGFYCPILSLTRSYSPA